MKSKLIFLFVVLGLLALNVVLASKINSAEVTLGWDANKESDIGGYKLHQGLLSKQYTEVTDVGNVTQYTVKGLLEGQTYFFALTAYDLALNESGFSSELLFVPEVVTTTTIAVTTTTTTTMSVTTTTLDVTPPAIPLNFRLIIEGNVSIKTLKRIIAEL